MVANVPLHVVQSSLERTGKTKLVESVLGGIILGRATPALQLSGRDEEIDKRIVAALIHGAPIRHVDNVREHLDSASLASLLTAETYSGRMLGKSQILDLPNRMILVATGNNVRSTGELAKRIVPIVLQPSSSTPEMRTDFVHPDLAAYVRRQRRTVVSALLGLIVDWHRNGAKPGGVPMGGFESWASVVGGILANAGCTEWCRTNRSWIARADVRGEDMVTLVGLWAERFGTSSASASDLADIARKSELFSDCFVESNEAAQNLRFVRRVLMPHQDTPVGGYIVRRVAGRTSTWRIDGNGYRSDA